jgi:hypothetical protein
MHTIDCLADDVTLTAAPVFHIGGLNVTTLVAFQKGALVTRNHQRIEKWFIGHSPVRAVRQQYQSKERRCRTRRQRS